MTINNKYQPLYVANDSTITTIENTSSNLQFCEVNNSINTISTPTLINQNTNEDLNLSAYDGTNINPIIQINNTHQHVNITSNLNVTSNLNCNNIKIDTLSDLITNLTIENNMNSSNYNNSNDLLTVISSLNSRINFLSDYLFKNIFFNFKWQRSMYPQVEKSPSFHLQLFYSTINEIANVDNIFLCTQNYNDRFLRLNSSTNLYSNTTDDENKFVFHFEKDSNNRIYLCQDNLVSNFNGNITYTDSIVSFMTNRIFTFDRRALFFQNHNSTNNQSNYSDTMAFDELQIKYEYIDYNDHSNIESFESDRHHSTHDDRIVCILKINIGEEQISTDQSENTHLTAWYTGDNSHGANDQSTNIINAKAGPGKDGFTKAYIQTELYSSKNEGKIFIGGNGFLNSSGDVSYPHTNGGAFRLHVFDNTNNNKQKLLNFIANAINSEKRTVVTPLSLANIIAF